jgi:DNA-directed RNA polymerase subunit H
VNLLNRKLELLLKFRNYVQKKVIEGKDHKDIVVLEKESNKEMLIRIIYRTSLTKDKVGVQYVRKMIKKVKDNYEKGIFIGKSFSHSARREAQKNNIEPITEDLIPSFNIFKHFMVPKHEILSKDEAQKLFKEYHIEPYKLPRIKSSDPAAFLIGAKPGDTLKIIRKSPTAGEYVTYRYVT